MLDALDSSFPNLISIDIVADYSTWADKVLEQLRDLFAANPSRTVFARLQTVVVDSKTVMLDGILLEKAISLETYCRYSFV